MSISILAFSHHVFPLCAHVIVVLCSLLPSRPLLTHSYTPTNVCVYHVLCHLSPHQGPFDVLVHKLTDYMVREDEDPSARNIIRALEEYVAKHPELVVRDPIPAVS